MTTIKAIELQRKTIKNGHIIVTYQAGDFVYYNEYENETAANEKNAQKILSKSYIQKESTGGYTHIYVNPQNPTQILKTLVYNSKNQLQSETHFAENKNKSLVRFYSNSLLTHAWSYSENGEIKLGTFYKKNETGKYDISHISKPVFDNKKELSHLVMMETFTDGRPTGKIIERTFYLLNKPAIRVNYVASQTTGATTELIYSQEKGKWVQVTDQDIQKQLKSIFKKMISLESFQNTPQLTLEKNSNITFEELYYHDITLFKETHSDLKVFIPHTDEKTAGQNKLN